MNAPTKHRRLVGAVGAVALTLGMTALAVTGSAGAKTPTNWSPSDSRATAIGGNAVTCAQAGIQADAEAFASGTGSINDGNVSGTVTNGTTVNVDVPGSNVTIVAIVVKGGPAYNVYTNPDVLPGGSHSGNYISPLNGGGNVPTVSHWFICYNLDEGPPPPPPTPGTGSLVLAKVATGDLTKAPATVTLEYQCDDAANTHGSVDLPGTGGSSAPIDGIDEGTMCTVTETTVIPTVTPVYSPADPSNTAQALVTINADETATATVTNGYPAVGGEVVVTPTPPVQVAAEVVASPAFTG